MDFTNFGFWCMNFGGSVDSVRHINILPSFIMTVVASWQCYYYYCSFQTLEIKASFTIQFSLLVTSGICMCVGWQQTSTYLIHWYLVGTQDILYLFLVSPHRTREESCKLSEQTYDPSSTALRMSIYITLYTKTVTGYHNFLSLLRPSPTPPHTSQFLLEKIHGFQNTKWACSVVFKIILPRNSVYFMKKMIHITIWNWK